jgi:hypothetical protein
VWEEDLREVGVEEIEERYVVESIPTPILRAMGFEIYGSIGPQA